MNEITTDIYFDLKDKKMTKTTTQILTKLRIGNRSLCKIHSDHLFLLQIYSPVKCEALFGGKSYAGLASMNLGELEDGVTWDQNMHQEKKN